MKLPTTILCSMLFVLASPDATAQSQATAEPFVLEAGEITVSDLLKHCSEYLGCNIIMSPQECAGTNPIKLQHSIRTDREGCEDLLSALLSRNNLALTVLNKKLNILEVINMVGARGREVATRAERKTPEQILARPHLKMPVITAIELKHINAQLANNALRPFFANGGPSTGSPLSIGNVGNSHSLLLQGMQDQVAAAITLIQTADAPSAQTEQDRTIAQRVAALEERIAFLEKRLARLAKARKEKD